MANKALCIFMLVCVAGLSGCVSIPVSHPNGQIDKDQLTKHVAFLAEPQLRGRTPGSRGSKYAREYIEAMFSSCGLKPWGNRKGYSQPLILGTNIIGVLPGSDPNLAQQIVIVSAHYDHLGKCKQGLCLGACDNASGVAALLEIADRLALGQQRPRRSVCFASFDCEEDMAMGALMFTCQNDFDNTKIAAVVNMDMLGRDLFDAVEHSICLIGGENRPALRQNIVAAGANAGMRVLPIGSDLIGPLGDHVAFEAWDMPVLFFTCGLNKDYHHPGDTPEKLNYQNLTDSAAIIAQTVTELANAPTIEPATQTAMGDRTELETVRYVAAQVTAKAGKIGLTPKQVDALNEFNSKRIEPLLAQQEYTQLQRREFACDAFKALSPLLVIEHYPGSEQMDVLPFMINLYAEHRKALIETARKCCRHVIKYKPGLFRRMPEFKDSFVDMTPDEFIVNQKDGRYELHAVLTKLEMSCSFGGIIPRGGISFSAAHKFHDCNGTAAEVTDYCILMWRAEDPNDAVNCIYEQMLSRITSQSHGTTCEQWIKWRLEQEGYTNTKEWINALVLGSNPAVINAILSQKNISDICEPALCKLLTDRKMREDVRFAAIKIAGKNKDSQSLLALVSILDDTTMVINKTNEPYTNPSHPFYKAMRLDSFAKAMDDFIAKNNKAMGAAALVRLKELTKKDFGTNKSAWTAWIETNKPCDRPQPPKSLP